MHEDLKKIKEHLKAIIKATPGLNQVVVAEKVGISQPYLNEILNSNKKGSFDLLNRIAETVGVSIKDLLSDPLADSSRIMPESEDEEKLLSCFRELDTKRKFLLLNIASDYCKYCRLVKEDKIKSD